MIRKLLSLFLVASLCGCAAIQPGNDPTVVNAERTIASAQAVVDSFLSFEYQNRPSLPYNVTKAADKLRVEFPVALNHALALKASYQGAKSADTANALSIALEVLRTLQATANSYLAKPTATIQPSYSFRLCLLN